MSGAGEDPDRGSLPTPGAQRGDEQGWFGGKSCNPLSPLLLPPPHLSAVPSGFRAEMM